MRGSPHFLLFSESRGRQRPGNCQDEQPGQWRFVLESVDGGSHFEAADDEAEGDPGRLELLAIVRGLEALDQPSRVTLVTSSRYVTRGLRFGLDEWRENGWQWERFGEMTPIRNGDLWRRVDQAMRIHQLECRTWRFDLPEERPRRPHVRRSQALAAATAGATEAKTCEAGNVSAAAGWRVLWACRRAVGEVLRRCLPGLEKPELRAA